jgi:hypothetical protein
MEQEQPHPPQPLRQWINKNSAAVTAITLVCIVGALLTITQQFKGPARFMPPMSGYFYDLETDQIFVAPLNEVPPINVPGELPGTPPHGVRAYVFACGDCNNPANRFLAWVETYTPEAKSRLLNSFDRPPEERGPRGFPEPDGRRFIGRGHLIAAPDPNNPDWKKHWVPFRSDEGTELLSRAQQRCNPQQATNICSPPERNDKR